MSQGNTNLDYTKAYRSLVITASAERIWDALTDADSVAKWLGNYAEVEPRVGGRYAFWGPSAWRGTGEADANQIITLLEPPSRLTFRWTIDGIEKSWTWEIEAAAGGCKVSATVDLPGNDKTYTYWLTLDTVELALLGLSSFLDSGEAAPMPDYTDPEPAAHLTITVNAPPDDVFAALTEPALMDKWVSEGAKVDLQIGGAYDFGWTENVDGVSEPAGPKKVVAVEPGKMISHDWHYAKEPETVVVWQVEGVGGSTVVTLTHTGFTEDNDHPAYRQGWMAFLYRLKAAVEGKPLVEKS